MKELLVKAKDAKSTTPISPLTGSICCFGSQSSVMQNTVTSDENAMYALYAAVAEDRIQNIKQSTRSQALVQYQEEPFYSCNCAFITA